MTLGRSFIVSTRRVSNASNTLLFQFSSQASLRYFSGARTLLSLSQNTTSATSASQPVLQQVPLTPEQRDILHSALRVNHVGELAAVQIYAAQYEPIVRADSSLQKLMNHMHDQEKHHFSSFERILPEHNVRPSALYPIWGAAAHTLGWVTGLMGKEAAMACTEAVETVIGHHYNDQIVKIVQWERDLNSTGKTLGPEMQQLLGILRQFRDEELEHLDHAVEHDAHGARPYELLTNVIKSGCSGAIWVAKRV